MHSSFLIAALSLAGFVAAAPAPFLSHPTDCAPGTTVTVTVTVTEGGSGPTTVPTSIPGEPTTTPSVPSTSVPGGGNPGSSAPTTTPGVPTTTPGVPTTTPGGGDDTSSNAPGTTTSPGGGEPTTTQPPTSAPPSSTGSVPPTTSATPTGGNGGDGGNGGSDAGHCNTGPVQCCNTVQSSSSHEMSGLLGLLGVVLSGADIPIGTNCSPLSVIGLGNSGCKSAPVCCENNEFNGLINIGCVPINISL